MTSRLHPALMAARVLIALLFLVAGMRKLMYYAATLGYFAQLGIPAPEVVLPLTILLEVGGGLAVIAGWRMQIVGPIMAMFTLGTALIAHRFWSADQAQFTPQLNNFLKNVSIMGAFIALAVQGRVDVEDQVGTFEHGTPDRAA